MLPNREPRMRRIKTAWRLKSLQQKFKPREPQSTTPGLVPFVDNRLPGGDTHSRRCSLLSFTAFLRHIPYRPTPDVVVVPRAQIIHSGFADGAGDSPFDSARMRFGYRVVGFLWPSSGRPPPCACSPFLPPSGLTPLGPCRALRPASRNCRCAFLLDPARKTSRPLLGRSSTR
jgi:hypothetical protein